MSNFLVTKPYNIIPSPELLTIRLIGRCDYKSVKLFQSDLSDALADKKRHVIFNCENLTNISKEWLREMMLVQATMKADGKFMRLIIVSNDVKKDLRTNGLDSVFTTLETLKVALSDLGLVNKKMLDIEFINPFLNATLHVLKVQASITAESGKIFVKKADDNFVDNISGIIGIVSDTFTGSVIISFPAQTFLRIMSGMLGEEFKEINKDILDGAEEITNLIFGQAKIVLNEKGYNIKTALPAVVYGKDLSLSSLPKDMIVIVPFKSSAGDFFVKISLSA